MPFESPFHLALSAHSRDRVREDAGRLSGLRNSDRRSRIPVIASRHVMLQCFCGEAAGDTFLKKGFPQTPSKDFLLCSEFGV